MKYISKISKTEIGEFICDAKGRIVKSSFVCPGCGNQMSEGWCYQKEDRYIMLCKPCKKAVTDLLKELKKEKSQAHSKVVDEAEVEQEVLHDDIPEEIIEHTETPIAPEIDVDSTLEEVTASPFEEPFEVVTEVPETAETEVESTIEEPETVVEEPSEEVAEEPESVKTEEESIPEVEADILDEEPAKEEPEVSEANEAEVENTPEEEVDTFVGELAELVIEDLPPVEVVSVEEKSVEEEPKVEDTMEENPVAEESVTEELPKPEDPDTEPEPQPFSISFLEEDEENFLEYLKGHSSMEESAYPSIMRYLHRLKEFQWISFDKAMNYPTLHPENVSMYVDNLKHVSGGEGLSEVWTLSYLRLYLYFKRSEERLKNRPKNRPKKTADPVVAPSPSPEKEELVAEESPIEIVEEWEAEEVNPDDRLPVLQVWADKRTRIKNTLIDSTLRALDKLRELLLKWRN